MGICANEKETTKLVTIGARTRCLGAMNTETATTKKESIAASVITWYEPPTKIRWC